MSLHFTILFTLIIISLLVSATTSTTTNFLPLPQPTMSQTEDEEDEEDSQTTTTTITTGDLTTYENSTYGLRIQYPSDWSIDEVDPAPEDRATHVVTFWAPSETPEDTYQERITVAIDNIPYRAELAEYLQESINLYKGNKDFEIVESNTDAKLAGNPAYLLTYTWTTEPENEDDPTYNLQTMEIATIIENKGYYISYNAEEDVYSDYLPTVQKMIDSFEILSVSPSATVSSDEAITLYNKGLDAANLENYEEAIQYFDRSLDIDPNNASALENKGWALYNLGRNNESIEYYDRALEIDSNNALRLNGKGIVLDALGRHNEAIEYYDRALNISPNDAVILTNKGLSLNDLGRYEEAIEVIDRALNISPNDVYALANKGMVLNNLGRYEEAIEVIDRALNISPNDAVTLNNKGWALYNLGRYEEAIEYYNKSLEIDPNYEIALDNKDLALAAINNSQGIDIQSRIPIQEEGNQTDDVQSVEGFLQYQNSSLGITMQYPSDWQQEDGDSDPIITYFWSPYESDSDKFSESLSLSVYNSENTSLEENVANILNSYSQIFTDFTPIELNPTTLAGNPAHRLVYFYSDPDIGPMESMQVLTVKDGILYNFIYLAEQSKYLKYLPTALDMLKSIEIGSPISDDGSGREQENAPPAELRPF